MIHEAIHDPQPVIVRSFNDQPLAAATLDALRTQTIPTRIIAFDNDSTDGTRELMDDGADRVVRVPRGSYVPGKVLNAGMAAAEESELVVFLNADCTPQDEEWLARLLAAAAPPNVAAAFSRQIPRPDCHPLYILDTERCYGDGSGQERAQHTFSMAASVVRRSVWQESPFDPELSYSEDVDWTWRARQRGYRISYAPASVAMHSHNYSLRQLYRRQRGEGEAEAQIFDWSPWRRSLLRYSVLPWGRQVLADWRYGLQHREWAAACRSPWHRAVQAAGRRRGFVAGLRRAHHRSPSKGGQS